MSLRTEAAHVVADRIACILLDDRPPKRWGSRSVRRAVARFLVNRRRRAEMIRELEAVLLEPAPEVKP